MNLKRTFGAILTTLGIIGLIYTAIIFVNQKGNTYDYKALITYGVIGFIFFSAGIGLIRSTKD